MYVKILFPNYHQDIIPEKCGALNSGCGEYFHHDLSNGEDISGQMEFTDDGRLLVGSNKKFSWICI
jgi:hypothetical protein